MQLSKEKKETPNPRDRWARWRRRSRTPARLPPTLTPQDPHPPSAIRPPPIPGPHSPCSQDRTPTLRPSEDTSPLLLSAAPGCALAPPRPAHREAGPPARRDWLDWVVPGAHWLPRLPVPLRRPAPAPAHSCGATWPPAPPPSAQSPARLRPRRLGAPGGTLRPVSFPHGALGLLTRGQGVARQGTPGPPDPHLFPGEPSGCARVGRVRWANHTPTSPHPPRCPQSTHPPFARWPCQQARSWLLRRSAAPRPAKCLEFGNAMISHIAETIFKACLLLESAHFHLYLDGEHGF